MPKLLPIARRRRGRRALLCPHARAALACRERVDATPQRALVARHARKAISRHEELTLL